MLRKLAFAASLVLIASAVHGQEFPTRPVTIVVPFAAGGPNDVLARFVADHMAHTLNQPVLIESPSYSSNPSTYGAVDTVGYPAVRS